MAGFTVVEEGTCKHASCAVTLINIRPIRAQQQDDNSETEAAMKDPVSFAYG